jgi:UDP-N-acetylglucosamine diphosphorylase/glucosamine-1-phosphate N-acetyltransferase
MTRLICLEPENPGTAWAPFTGVRPLAELRAGAWRIRERWAGILGLDEVAVMGSHITGFADVDSAPVIPEGPIDGPVVVVRSDFAPGGAALELDSAARRLVHENSTVAWIVPDGARWSGRDDLGPAQAIDGMPLVGTWDLVTALEHFLAPDCADALAAGSDPVPDGSIVLGDPGDVACFGAGVEPGVVFDVRHGVVVLEEGVEVRSGTRLEGPLFVGPGSIILGGAVRHSVIGPQCRVQGELSASILLGYCNKSHDGFVGHSVLGHWTNLGAGTITSNLKNTYGEVRLELPTGRVETGRTNLGSLIGDHAKTAIGTLLGAGTVVGAGASVVGAPVGRWVRPFLWGSGEGLLTVDGFVNIAKRVMPRRKVEVSAGIETWLRAMHAGLAR